MSLRVAEVEIKKRLASKSILMRVESALIRSPDVVNLGCVVQRDIFVDQDLKINSAEPKYNVFRIRSAASVHTRPELVLPINFDSIKPAKIKYVGTVKGPTVLVNGIARTDEDEAEIPPEVANSLLTNPSIGLGSYRNPLIDRVVARFSLDAAKGVTLCGEYTTIRSKYQINSWTKAILASQGIEETPILELDETMYEFGSAYEIEVETSCPEYVETLLMNLLQENSCAEGVTNSLKSKYTNFIEKKIDGK